VDKPVENLKPVEKNEFKRLFPNFHNPDFSTACGKVENKI
jgi:hypothetical protein